MVGEFACRTTRAARRSRSSSAHAPARSPSLHSVGPSTPSVFIPSPSSVKAIASADSAMPYEGRSASFGSRTSRTRRRTPRGSRAGSARRRSRRRATTRDRAPRGPRSLDALDAERVGEVRREGDRAAVAGDRLEPLTGRFKKRSGGRYTIGMRCTSGASTKPMSPMSW